MAKRLIITADDMGYNVERNSGIIECFKNKGVTNSSIMVNGVACQDAALRALETGLPTGLHFNIAEGVPVNSDSNYTTLTTRDGRFLDVDDLRTAAGEGKIDVSEVKTELKRQVARYEELVGRKPVYVDGHKHGHLLPGIVQTFAETLKELGIRATRLQYELDQELATWNHDPWREMLFITSQEAEWARPVLKANNIWTSDRFYGLMTMGRNMTAERLQTGILRAFASLAESADPGQPVTCELMTHPGFACEGAGGCGDGPDEFAKSSDREYEKSILEGEEMQQFYREHNITLMSYHECCQV
ncbi:carbohydrate deacetylase-like [Babylonia areolata]|uniref:carbohydrate deacetylase-like n=1 Tax=Babylonia areolata TaxID=304850 RepID=UPI003FD176D6